MGSGNKFSYGKTESFGMGFCISRFPFELTIGINFAWFYLSIGFGKGYDQ